MISHTTAFATSRDGTTIGYRQLGHGPAAILVHGGMMAAQNLMKLASALAAEFTVYVPDRRGRGLSGPHGNRYCLARECEDIEALVAHTGATNVFGSRSGAVLVLGAALSIPSVRRVALYEPPLPVEGASPTAWVAHDERELARGDLAAAMVTVIKGTEDSSLLAFLRTFFN
ncbi:MAG TPA: alpha/beta hydrolase [Polyangiaceae bacterium]